MLVLLYVCCSISILVLLYVCCSISILVLLYVCCSDELIHTSITVFATGIEYTLARMPIGSTDFSTHAYSYDDIEGDLKLNHFTLASEDILYKVSMSAPIYRKPSVYLQINAGMYTRSHSTLLKVDVLPY